MKYLLILCFALAFPAQAQKKTYYWNDDLQRVTAAEHATLPGYDRKFELDTAFVIVKVMGRKNGKIASDLLEKIRSGLSQTSGVAIAEDDTIVIHYHPGADRCNSSGNLKRQTERMRKYMKKLQKHPKVKGFFVYKDPGNTESYGKHIPWIQDPDQLVERCFFRIHYGCGSAVIMWPDGSYHAIRGEHDKAHVFSQLAIGPEKSQVTQKP